MWSLITDPKIFNYVLVLLYTLNIFRWAWQGNIADVGYWTGALIITICVTWGYAR